MQTNPVTISATITRNADNGFKTQKKDQSNHYYVFM